MTDSDSENTSPDVDLSNLRVLTDQLAASVAASMDLPIWDQAEFDANPDIQLLLFLSESEAIRWVSEHLLPQGRIAGVVAWLLDEMHINTIASWPVRLRIGSLRPDELPDFLASPIGPHSHIQDKASEISRIMSIAQGA